MASAESQPIDDKPLNLDGLQQSALHKEFIQRLVNGRDLRVYITAEDSATGVGKTTLAVALAMLWDQSGWSTDKATLDPREFSAKYDEVEPGSVLVLDEAEQALERRRSNRTENVEVSHDFATKRYKQIFGILTLPTKSMLDKRVANKLSDYWIQCQETDTGTPKGEARVYRLGNNDHYETDYSKRVEVISWPRLDGHPEFERLTEMKKERMEGNVESKFVRREEVEEIKKNFWNKAWDKRGYEIMVSMDELGYTKTDIAEVFDLSQPRISQILGEDSFEEAYTSYQ